MKLKAKTYKDITEEFEFLHKEGMTNYSEIIEEYFRQIHLDEVARDGAGEEDYG